MYYNLKHLCSCGEGIESMVYGTRKGNWSITTTADDLAEGLFGQIVLYIFEILPYLYSHSIYPAWDIKSKLYGVEPNFTIIPGIFDLAYELHGQSHYHIRLSDLRKYNSFVLGNNWHELHDLWHSFFRVPERIVADANKVGDLTASLGIHYRGTDKMTSCDTNPVSQGHFIEIINDFISKRPAITSLFIATDEFSIVAKIQESLPSMNIINLGGVEFHKDQTHIQGKADRALLDCLLLSRCKYLLMGTSALSGFAKVLNPNLDVYRISASKLFTDIPYFPVAYIPCLKSNDDATTRILHQLFADDWLTDLKTCKKFNVPFCYKTRRNFLDKLLLRLRAVFSMTMRHLRM